ncbi:proton-conducting transporter membrane subunit [Ectothiorhodospira variabilis]|uniref:proton-conducting transporter transmembrane domain-containing protein n=1 Tax=Ectothiorhodospira variabilis TaxID=505694 RepID=UPI001EFB5F2E|nr:proton-conducting transporter membrane subunit [Ectothiorhodospira variabilis]MCG5496986.1 monovalent cation/H+ antiporter subunit D family protein [Ectothiorhodospira variabilis]
MEPGGFLLVIILMTSLVPGLVIFFLREQQFALRTFFNLGGAGLKLALIISLLVGVYRDGKTYSFTLNLLPGIDLVLAADALSLLFATLSAVLWLVTTIYAIGYLEHSPKRSRFFGFFSLCVSATVGIAFSGNLVTMLIFYEILTLATWPLVVHRGTPDSFRAGRIYLAYTLIGGAVLLAAVVWLTVLAGSQDFTAGGYLRDLYPEHEWALTLLFLMFVVGFGVKAALLPLHSWLPRAMVAPAPVSALLHAVAVVKAGAFGIVRVMNDVYGIQLAADMGMTLPLMGLAILTVLYGSVRALFTQDLKRRLAFSTVSQVSYIIIGVALAGPVGAVGGLVHLVHQGVMKITLFFCAGNFAETLGIHRIEEMRGVGRRMPWTMAAFTLGGLGMIGAPPMAGFITKWYLGMGALEVGQGWVIGVLLVSSLLNAAYFLPPILAGWFGRPQHHWSQDRFRDGLLETHWMLLLPTLAVAAMALGMGLLASLSISPLYWVTFIVEFEYGYEHIWRAVFEEVDP